MVVFFFVCLSISVMHGACRVGEFLLLGIDFSLKLTSVMENVDIAPIRSQSIITDN